MFLPARTTVFATKRRGRGPRGPGEWGLGRPYSSGCAERAGAVRCQCITVTANATMMAALSEPITASDTISLRYLIATLPRFGFIAAQALAAGFGSAGTAKNVFGPGQNDLAAGWGTAASGEEVPVIGEA